MSRITQSAKGMPCQIRYPDVCNHNPETTVWCHGNGMAAGRGVGLKCIDLNGAYGCYACHDVYDGRTPLPPTMTRLEADLWFWEGHARSLVILAQHGLVRV